MAAELVLEADAKARLANDYLLEAERYAEEAERYLGMAVQADEARELAAAEAEILAAAIGADVDVDAPTLITAALDTAGVVAEQVRGNPSAEARAMRKEISAIRADAARLREGLDR